MMHLPYEEKPPTTARDAEPTEPELRARVGHLGGGCLRGCCPGLLAFMAACGSLGCFAALLHHDCLLFEEMAEDWDDDVQTALESGANPECSRRGGETHLHYATKHKSLELVALFLQHGANPNRVDDKGRTALHFAAEQGSPELCVLLLEHGADPHAQDRQGKTPPHCAAEKRNAEALAILKAAAKDDGS